MGEADGNEWRTEVRRVKGYVFNQIPSDHENDFVDSWPDDWFTSGICRI